MADNTFHHPTVAESRAELAATLRAMKPARCNCYYWTLKFHQCKAKEGQPVLSREKES